MDKVYTRINWENSPSTKTPIGALNLNRADYAINEIDNRVVRHDTEKADRTQIVNLVRDWTMDESTGIITVTKYSGERIVFDLNVEKIPVSFSLSHDGILTMVTADGTRFTANIGAMIPVLQFNSTDTIIVNVSGTGINRTYSFDVKPGSITEDKFRPNFLADIRAESTKAENAASAAGASAQAAKNSENAAAMSESSALASRQAAEESKNAAALSEQAAKASEAAALLSEQAAARSGAEAKQSEESAKASEYTAVQSAQSAELSKTAAKESEDNAAESALDARESAERAQQGAANAGWIEFHIDSRGHLICEKTETLSTSFRLNNGHLEVILE